MMGFILGKVENIAVKVENAFLSFPSVFKNIPSGHKPNDCLVKGKSKYYIFLACLINPFPNDNF